MIGAVAGQKFHVVAEGFELELYDPETETFSAAASMTESMSSPVPSARACGSTTPSSTSWRSVLSFCTAPVGFAGEPITIARVRGVMARLIAPMSTRYASSARVGMTTGMPPATWMKPG